MRFERFVTAHDTNDTHTRAMREIRNGRKTTHWMWFIFPNVAGLGRSDRARTFALTGLDEAADYLNHPTLGPRLIEAARAVLNVEGRTAVEILGETDAMKLRSSMTLFALAAPDEPVFRAVLDKFFDGERDPLTERIVA